MSRATFLVAYDIADPKRLYKVAKTMAAFGDRLQYSVFVCRLDRMEHARMRSRLNTVLHHSEDAVMILRLGPVDVWKTALFLGPRPKPPNSRLIF